MCLIIKIKSDEHYINLPTVNEMIAILLNEYNQLCFYNIMICFHYTEDIQYNFSYIYFNYTAYILCMC